MDNPRLEAMCRENGISCEFDHILAPNTSMKIGGPCDIFLKVGSESQLAAAVGFCRGGGIPFFILGKGSNLLVSSAGFRGCVIALSSASPMITVDGYCITAWAGAALHSVCLAALEHSLTGLEFAYGIPGSVGGALFMNAGAYGGEMRDIVTSCRYLNENGSICEMSAEEMQLSYRSSVFSHNGGVITSVTMKLSHGERDAIRSRMDELMQRRRDKQPLEYPSCGSTFKRPEGYYAAALIEECGLKGFTVGGAQVSEKHSGFVINRSGATFEDVMAVVEEVRRRVLEQKGIRLECEMLILG